MSCACLVTSDEGYFRTSYRSARVPGLSSGQISSLAALIGAPSDAWSFCSSSFLPAPSCFWPLTVTSSSTAPWFSTVTWFSVTVTWFSVTVTWFLSVTVTWFLTVTWLFPSSLEPRSGWVRLVQRHLEAHVLEDLLPGGTPAQS